MRSGAYASLNSDTKCPSGSLQLAKGAMLGVLEVLRGGGTPGLAQLASHRRCHLIFIAPTQLYVGLDQTGQSEKNTEDNYQR